MKYLKLYESFLLENDQSKYKENMKPTVKVTNEAFEGSEFTNLMSAINDGGWKNVTAEEWEKFDGEKWKVGEKVSIKNKSYSNDPKSLNGEVNSIGLNKDGNIMIEFKSEKGALTQFSPEELEKN